MRRWFYLIVEAPDESRVGGVDSVNPRFERATKNEQVVIEKRNHKTDELYRETVVGLGYHDFADEDTYEENAHSVMCEKLMGVDAEHLRDAGLDPDEVPEP